jgi:DNA-directed RNA polymerase subunit M/transcription elongation factor TFIIS
MATSMRFCPLCDCFLWMELDEEDKLQFHCRNCANVIQHSETHSLCVMDTNYIEEKTNFQQYMTKFLKHDPTLPRVKNIECVNGSSCTKPADKGNEVIFVKYDATQMKYLYHCVYCDAFWKSDNAKQAN